MIKTYILKILDSAFVAVCAFLISFVLLSYFFAKPSSLVCGITIALLCGILAFKKISDKNRDSAEAEKTRRDVERALGGLCFASKKEVENIMSKLLPVDCEKKKGGFQEEKAKVFHFAVFSFEGLTKTDVAKAFNKISERETAVIYTAFCQKEILDFASLFEGKIKIIYGSELYSLLKEKSLLDKIKGEFSAFVPKKKASFKNLINKNRAKSFFAFGAALTVLSFVVPYKLYYIVCGSIFLALSLVCKFFGKDPKGDR